MNVWFKLLSETTYKLSIQLSIQYNKSTSFELINTAHDS